MLHKVLNAIEKYKMLTEGESVFVALSGGADSVCLLLALIELKELRLNISAIHINHQLRGEESDSDEEFCKNLCTRLEIPFFAEKVDVISYAAEKNLSAEHAARELRYKKLSEIAGNSKIATAHTLNDSAETMLINFTRGTGIKGLRGIPSVRGNIIRPLVFVTREEEEVFLSERNQDYVTDKTNFEDVYTRNKIRHNVIPILREINPGFYRTVLTNQSAFETDSSFIDEIAQEAYEKCSFGKNKLCGLSNYHKAVRHRCIIRLLDKEKISYSFERINAVDNILLNGGKIMLTENYSAVSKNGELWLEIPSKAVPEFEAEISEGKNRFIGDRICTIKTELFDKNNLFLNVHENLTSCILDYDKIKGTPTLRNRRSGDRIRLSGKNFTSSVKKLLNEKIPLKERPLLCFIADDEGVIFIEGIGTAERVKPDNDTRRIMTAIIEKISEP